MRKPKHYLFCLLWKKEQNIPDYFIKENDNDPVNEDNHGAI